MSNKKARKAKGRKRKAHQHAPKLYQREKRMSSSSHRQKLAWANTHIDVFEALLTEWSGDSYRVTQKTDCKGRTRMFGQLAEPIPDQLSLIAGDAFQCLRNSLDHIVFSLSKKGTPNMTADDEEKPMFPITRGTKAIADTNGSIQFLTPPARKAVLDLTPDPTRENINGHPLFVLNKMSNRDKHRAITLLAMTHAINVSLSDSIAYLRGYGGDILKVGAEPVLIVEYQGRLGPNSNVRGTPVIQFGQGSEVAGQDVIHTLRGMSDYIGNVVFQSLEDYL